MPGIANNERFAQMLHQIAALLAEQGVQFKPAAYRKAAQTIENLDRDISTFTSLPELLALPGIGEAIAAKALEFNTTGRIKHLDELMAAQGGLSPELMEIEDLGPKRVRLLQKELNITTVKQLVEAAKTGKLRNLERFSELMEKKILENAGNVKERSMRHPLEDVKPVADKLKKAVIAVKGVERAEIAGSFRRGKATVGDLDVLTVTNDAEKVSDAIAKLPIVRHVVAHGGTKLSFDLLLTKKKDGPAIRVDIRFVKRDEWGSALLYFTGDKEHNITLRKIAIKNGWKLNEYGLFEGEKRLASKEEEDIYKKLGLTWVDPTKRTGDIR